MNPNSQNQRWSKWTITVTPGRTLNRPFSEVRENTARFMKKGFGSSSQMRIRKIGLQYVVEVRTEGKPVHEPGFVKYMSESFDKFFVNGFGLGTKTKIEAKLEAGSRQDGTPAEQLLILPSVSIGEN